MADFAPLINGIQMAGSSVRINILGVSLPGLKGIEFKMTHEKNNVYAAGANVNARTYGRRIFAGKLTVLMSDLNALEAASPDNNPTALPPFDIIVTYREGTQVISYTLVSCEFTEWGLTTKTDDKEVSCELPFIYADQKRTR